MFRSNTIIVFFSQLTNEERMGLLSKISAMQRAEGQSDEDDDEDDEEVRANERVKTPSHSVFSR